LRKPSCCRAIAAFLLVESTGDRGRNSSSARVDRIRLRERDGEPEVPFALAGAKERGPSESPERIGSCFISLSDKPR